MNRLLSFLSVIWAPTVILAEDVQSLTAVSVEVRTSTQIGCHLCQLAD